MRKRGAHRKFIAPEKKPVQNGKEQGEEIENKLEEQQTNKPKDKVKLIRCDSMGHLKPDLSLDAVKPESHADVPKAVQDESTKDINVPLLMSTIPVHLDSKPPKNSTLMH